MRVPTATYRLQFHSEFRFVDAQERIDYFSALGISDIYASPVFKARPGSTHGYDVINHGEVDPALGGEQGFTAFSAALKAQGMGLILDIVPNHMGIATSTNLWWMDVLENGPSSSYAGYFDIDWQPVNPHLENKVLLPILEDLYGNVLEEGKLRLACEEGAFFIYYHDVKLPIAPGTYAYILERRLDPLTHTLGKDHPTVLEFQSILTAIAHLPPLTETDPEKLEELRREKEVIKRRIAALYQTSPEARGAIDLAVWEFNGTVGNPQSFDLLDGLMDAQPYRLAFWRVAGEEINYRRFFDINELAAIHTETPEVFQATHQLILRFLAEGKITGLRIDHPDGLWDPTGYFHQLQQSSSSRGDQVTASNAPLPVYIVAEKILAKEESLPQDWEVCGTTGYDFLNQVNGMFVRRANRRAFDKIYRDFTGSKTSFRALANSSKKMIMLVSLASEINALSHQLDKISERNRHYRDFTLNSLTFAIREVIACLSVYRTYTNASSRTVSERDQKYIAAAVQQAKRQNPRTARALFDFVGDTLLLRNLHRFGESDRPHIVEFVMEFQQLTGPVMAKAVEDTAFYVYNRLVSLNEVGGDPEEFGISLEAFHRHNRFRQKHWPHSMLSLTTHDTKRSEDVRARINVLSEVPGEWKAALKRWHGLNASKKQTLDGEVAPDRNDEYLLYQTLIGAWPARPQTEAEFEDFRERIAAYMLKAIKEAKVHTSWVNPNEAYDQAMNHFVRGILAASADDAFVDDFSRFCQRIAYVGMLNSLAQTLLKITSPGVPDFYQGTELWDLSLVDPDNRRPVDFAKRSKLLRAIKDRERENHGLLASELLETWPDGRVKLYVTHCALELRRTRREIFQDGDYLPVYAAGAMGEHVCAFLRRRARSCVLVAVPRFLAALVSPGEKLTRGAIWQDGALALPDNAPSEWLNIFTGEPAVATRASTKSSLPLSSLFARFPVALLAAISGE